MNTERGVFLEEHDGFRNGIYERRMKTKFGGIDGFAVPRGREGNYRTAVFWPYSKSIGVDELIISLHSREYRPERLLKY